MKVEFNEVGEFIDELRHGGAVEKVLRVTQQFEQDQEFPALSHVSVIATFVVDRGGLVQLVCLRRYIGDSLGDDQQSQKVLAKAKGTVDRICRAALEFGFESRPGVYVMDDAPKTKRGDPPII